MTVDGRQVVVVSRTVAIVPAACAVARAVLSGIDAWRLHAAVLLAIPAAVACALIGAALAVEVSTRRSGYESTRAGAPVLLIASACALAIGNAPGIALASLAETAAAVGLLAILAAFLSGPVRSSAPRAATVLYFAALGAAWQVGVAPFLAIALVRA